MALTSCSFQDVKSIDFHVPAIPSPDPVLISPSRKTATLSHLLEAQAGTTGVDAVILN